MPAFRVQPCPPHGAAARARYTDGAVRAFALLTILALTTAQAPVDVGVRASAIVDPQHAVHGARAVDGAVPLTRGLPAAEPQPMTWAAPAGPSCAARLPQTLQLQTTEPRLRLGCPPQGPPARA